MGRPAKAITPEQRAQVEAWVKARVPIEAMARRIGFAPKTFRKHFAAELGLTVDQVEQSMPPGTVVVDPPRALAFRPTDEHREMVLILAGANFSREEIARKAGVTIEVLEEHFAAELVDGPVKCNADVIRSLFYAAKGGNVSAQRTWLLISGRPTEGEGAGKNKNDPQRQPAAQGLQGKKASADLAAQTAEKGSPFDGLLN